jgi:class 3 adenylate cyclase
VTASAAAGQNAEPVAERRVCSVLFCDVVGFTPLSESRDPEAVRELLSEYFAVARTVVNRYGGVIEKFIGDAAVIQELLALLDSYQPGHVVPLLRAERDLARAQQHQQRGAPGSRPWPLT